MKSLIALAALLLPLICQNAHANVTDVTGGQGDYEREVGAVVRNKRYYKAGKIELGIDAGVLPYESVSSNYQFGGRLTWHISDHLAWQILDAQVVASTVDSSYIGGLSGAAGAGGLADVETVLPKMFIGTNLLVSPTYGKIRFFGSSVVYFDVYGLIGLGAAKTETHKFSTVGTSGTSVNDSIVNSGMGAMGDLALGFRIFMGSGFGLNIDMRDYLAWATTYGSSSAKNFFVVTFGLSYFIPSFGS